jgi:acetoin utilization deacetylase AcuC-like enzyme
MEKEAKRKVYCTYQEAPGHNFPGHPESPRRVHALRAWIDSPPYPEVEWLDYSPAEESEVSFIHDKMFLAELKTECRRGTHEFEPSPTYVTESSYHDALGAVGAVLAVSRRIISEGTGTGFAIVRPPGHHADFDTSMGFCLLNNIAIAAADAVASGAGKVAIVDFDAHHGNGTQAIFSETSAVTYISTHETGIFPGTGTVDSAPHARGRIVNIPLPAFAGNEAFQQVLKQVVYPVLAHNTPEMIFVSAGFDAHFSDPLTNLSLDTDGYFMFAQALVEMAETFCNGRLMFVLEGGYDPIAIQDNIQACLAAISGHSDYPDHYGKAPAVNPDVSSLINKLRKIHSIEE